MATLSGTRKFFRGACGELGDSNMELERPGEEKKKRWEAKTVAKSGGDSSASDEMSEALEKES